MNHVFSMKETFGEFLADGDLANRFRFTEVESQLGLNVLVVFDFSGVTNMTESFAHACFGALEEDHQQSLFEKVRFSNCSPLIRSFISAAMQQGLVRGANHSRR